MSVINPSSRWTAFTLIAIALLAGSLTSPVNADTRLAQATPGAPPPTPQERAAMLKQWLAASKAQLRNYEWVETTVVTVNGEEKSSSQKNCYYGVDGTLEKVPLPGATQAEEPRGPLRRAIAENKKEEMTEYMQSAVSLIHSYIPPDPAAIQNSINSGNLAVNVVNPGQEVQLQFKNYLKTGDVLGADIELATNRLMGLQVNSYLNDPSDTVSLDVTMGVLPDGTIYEQEATLTAPAKNIVVTVQNSGYRKSGS